MPELGRCQGCVGGRAGNVMGKAIARWCSQGDVAAVVQTLVGELEVPEWSLWDEDLEVAFLASLVAKLDEGWEEIWGRVSGVSSFCSCIPDQQQSAVATISCDSNQQISPATASATVATATVSGVVLVALTTAIAAQ